MLLAEMFFQKQNYEAAITKFYKLLEKKPNNYLALSNMIKLFRRAGRLCDVPCFIERAERPNARALSHPGLNFCLGLHCRYSNDMVGAIKFFNLARRDGKWGFLAIINMIELYLNLDDELRQKPESSGYWHLYKYSIRWDDSATFECSLESVAIAAQLLKELKAFVVPDDYSLKIQVLEAYIFLASRSRGKIDAAMQIFIDILEKEKDYLPALLGMSTAFMLEKSMTKARNALKRIAKITYSHELAEEFERGYLLLADIYIQKSKFDLSEELCGRCLKYNLSCGRAWETMGIIREMEASYKDAADMYERVEPVSETRSSS